MSFEPLDYVRHSLGEVEYLVYASAGVDESTFFAARRCSGPSSAASR